MILYRAINNKEEIDSNIYGSYVCNLLLHNDKNENYFEIVKELHKDFSLSLDRIINHINRDTLYESPWISTSKDFNYVLNKYAILQAGDYNKSNYRKSIIVIDTDKKIDLHGARYDKNISTYEGKFIDLSDNHLKEYYEKNILLPIYNNRRSSYYNISSDIIDINSLNKEAKLSSEVLMFYKIPKENIKYVLTPLMQDIIYCHTSLYDNLLRNKDSIDNMNKIVDLVYRKYCDFDFEKLKLDLTYDEYIVYKYLYESDNHMYNTLISKLEEDYNIHCNIETLYNYLKLIKKNILTKITNINHFELIDDKIYALNNEDRLKDKKIDENNVIYYVNNDRKLVRHRVK